MVLSRLAVYEVKIVNSGSKFYGRNRLQIHGLLGDNVTSSE